MEIIAFYLPQFHSIPENDEWWGEGFTEWTNVRKSKPFFKGHIQPEVPLNNNYYNLLDASTQEWQDKLAQEYGVTGFCYYHYWFDGKMLLEKPMENMLRNRKIKTKFCICWANESWARTWDGKETNILIEQNYNENEEGWKRHFEYLLDFFKDDRYILYENKPLMLIYKPHLIPHINEMVKYWNDLAIDNGFAGMYIGFQHPSAFGNDLDSFDFGVEFEPLYTIKELKPKNKTGVEIFRFIIKNPKWLPKRLYEKVIGRPEIYDYDFVWNTILKRTPCNNIFPGAFTSWDNTPRKGKKSICFKGANPQKFEKYFARQIERTRNIYNSPFVFINAWNEWAEGAHLEPDENNKFGYLEAIKSILEQ